VLERTAGRADSERGFEWAGNLFAVTATKSWRSVGTSGGSFGAGSGTIFAKSGISERII
jgi:hypothetical protein